MRSLHLLPIAVGALVALASTSCGRSEPSGSSERARALRPIPGPERVTGRPANPGGVVPILEYHRVSKKEARWDRSIVRFRGDLERLHKLGFRPITMADFLDGKLSVAPGASPVVLTFDDSDPSQFALREDGSVDPECAVGIWLEFERDHPDFPVRATFYVLPPVPWAQKALLSAKLELLKKWRCEIGSHTMTHRNLSKLADDEVRAEFADSIDAIAALGFRASSVALPFGISPRRKELLGSFRHRGKSYELRGALLVGAGPSRSPADPLFDRFRIPRIQAIEGDYGITFWLDRFESGAVEPYVAP